MKNRKKLVATGCVLVAILAISTLSLTLMQTRSAPGAEPTTLDQLINYPGMVNYYHLSDQQLQYEITNLNEHGLLNGIPLEGYFDMRATLRDKGYIFTDSFFDVFIEYAEVSTPEGEYYFCATYMQWSEEGPNGTKALLTGATVMPMGPGTPSSIIIGTPTNVLPPEEMPGVDPYIIWNAEPYFYVQWYWWRPWPYTPYWRNIYWKYWWYDSHKSQNWFWGPYWWWRAYVRTDTALMWRPWYWWWWHWYYWRGWYWWSTYWPYG